MSGGWSGSDRKSRLPPDWPQRREAVRLRAGGRCEVIRSKTGKRCPSPGSDCDHIVRGDNHELDNLQWICRWHHNAKTTREGNEARAQIRATARRAPEQHPGRRR